MKNHIDNLIRGLELEKRTLERKLQLAYQLRDADKPPEATANHKPAKDHRGAGFVTLILPLLQQQGAQSADNLYKYLRMQPGMKGVQKGSFESTLYSEIKKARPRIRKVSPGMYAANPLADQDSAQLTLEASSELSS